MSTFTQATPYLLTPGPLTTSASVKAAMLQDLGSWDADFNQITAWLCQQLLTIADAEQDYACVPMQGSGTFSVEAALASLIAPGSTSLVLANGAYGQRIKQMLDYLRKPYVLLDTGDFLPVTPDALEQCLQDNPEIEQVIVVHCETSSGIRNPIEMISALCQAYDKGLIIDSMSGFGALPCRASELHYRALIASPNKCLHGVPGFGFVIVEHSWLAQCAGNSHSLSLDLHAQWQYMEKTSQWRFTPPTHVVAAAVQAVKEYWFAGGQPARLQLYQQNHRILLDGMHQLGFQTLLPAIWQSPMITTFFAPEHPQWHFADFYRLIKQQGYLIYPGKLTEVNSFRVGSMGELSAEVMIGAVKAITNACVTLGVDPQRCPPIPTQQYWTLP